MRTTDIDQPFTDSKFWYGQVCLTFVIRLRLKKTCSLLEVVGVVSLAVIAGPPLCAEALTKAVGGVAACCALLTTCIVRLTVQGNPNIEQALCCMHEML